MAQIGRCEGQVAVNDAVCVTVTLDETATDGIDLWENETNYRINGTILVENNGATGAPTATLVGTDEAAPLLEVDPGSAQTVTVDDITTLSLAPVPDGTTGSSSVKISFSLNYKY